MRRRFGPSLLIAAVVGLAACSSSAASQEAASAPAGNNTGIDIAGQPRPGEGSPEAGFARDMSVHHAQAVAMAEAIRDRTVDPDLKLLATDIALGQQGQIGRMSGWLDEWGLDPTSTATPMAWIRADNLLGGPAASPSGMAGMDGMDGMHAGTDMAIGADGRMPGMASRPQVSALSTLPVAAAEVSFLELMIVHHRAGVEMAQAVLARSSRVDVVRLATSIVNSQQAEITLMTEMLAKRGATP